MAKDIFKFVHSNENVKLEKLSEKDLNEFIRLLDLFLLEYREELCLPIYVTFGTEIEFIPYDYKKFRRDFYSVNFKLVNETTKEGMLEAISPIMRDKKEKWTELKDVVDYIKARGVSNMDTGGHIHFGSHILKNEDKITNFFKLWCAFEKVIYRFGYGEYLSARNNILKHSKPLAFLKRDLAFSDFETIKKELLDKTYGFTLYAFDGSYFSNNNTIEIRCPNGTLEEAIWQNNINFFARLLLYASSASFDEELINNRLKNFETRHPYISTFDEIYFEDAILLCDLIFDKAIDKIYFLKQYLKNFETISQSQSKASTFVLK